MSRLLAVVCLLLHGCSAETIAQRAEAAASPSASAFVVAPTCAATAPGDARELVPDDATAIVGIDLASARKSTLFADVLTAMRSMPELAMALDTADACGVGGAAQRGITVGMRNDDVLAVLRADGLGKDATIDCIAKKIESELGRTPWTKKRGTCHTELDLLGGGRVFVLGDDTVVMATDAWQKSVAERLAGKGRSAMAGKLAWAWSTVDTSRMLWFAAEVPSATSKSLGVAGIASVGGSVDATTGLALHVGAGFHDTAKARAAAKELEDQRSKLELAAPLIGIPTGVVSGIGIAAHGTRVDVTATISEADVVTLRRWVEGTIGGSAGAAQPGPTPRL